MSLQIGGIVGDYKITGVLGSGAAGQVYKVEHKITGRQEAMKVLLRGGAKSPELAERFLREIRVHASLSHPNIVSVHNAMWAGEDLVMVMELVEGESLETLLAREPLPLDRAVHYMTQALAALDYAHSRGVIHRDVSPANMLVTRNRSLKLMDFGLALQPADTHSSTPGAPLGSLPYMSPEQVRASDSIDFKSDIYSLGAVLYHTLTRRPPFTGANPFELMRAHVEREPQPPSKADPIIPPALDPIVLRALAKIPGHRYRSAEEFRSALETFNSKLSAAASAPLLPGLWSSVARPALALIAGLAIVLSVFALAQKMSRPLAQPASTGLPAPAAPTPAPAVAPEAPLTTAAAESPRPPKRAATVSRASRPKPVPARQEKPQPQPMVAYIHNADGASSASSSVRTQVIPEPPRIAPPTINTTLPPLLAAPAVQAPADGLAETSRIERDGEKPKRHWMMRTLGRIRPFRRRPAPEPVANSAAPPPATQQQSARP